MATTNRDKTPQIQTQLIPTELRDVTLKLIHELQEHHKETYLHSVDTANTALFIAQQMGMSEKEQAYFYTAALLHDIGKLTISKELLDKENPTKEDLSIIRLGHIINSKIILEKYNFPQSLVRIVYHHHERLDGSGYPQGLFDASKYTDKQIKTQFSKEQITASQQTPITQCDKILQVADCTSAMRMPRKYRTKHISEEECCQKLQQMAEDGIIDKDIAAIAINYVVIHAKDNISGTN